MRTFIQRRSLPIIRSNRPRLLSSSAHPVRTKGMSSPSLSATLRRRKSAAAGWWSVAVMSARRWLSTRLASPMPHPTSRMRLPAISNSTSGAPIPRWMPRRSRNSARPPRICRGVRPLRRDRRTAGCHAACVNGYRVHRTRWSDSAGAALAWGSLEAEGRRTVGGGLGAAWSSTVHQAAANCPVNRSAAIGGHGP